MRLRLTNVVELAIVAVAAVAALAVARPAFAATVNINTAQQSELQRVKGLSKAQAKAIIDHRHKTGFYLSIAELEKVPGMSHEVVARVRPELAITGDSYVPGKVTPAPGKEAARKEPAKRIALNQN
jgi:competence protein ComEA